MMAYSIHKPFSYDALASTVPLRTVFGELSESYLTRNWSSLRTLLQGDARTSYVAQLEKELCEHDPSIADRVDKWLLNRSKSDKVGLEKTFPPLRDEFWQATGSTDVLLAWLYWKYSNDSLGVGKGLSDTFLEKIFGDFSLHMWGPEVQRLKVKTTCPYCAGEAVLCATSARPHADYRLHASISCSSCGHEETTAGFAENDPPSLNCDCQRCIEVRERAAASARQVSAATITSLATEVRQMVDEAIVNLTLKPRPIGLSEIGQRFVALANAKPTETLVDLICSLMSGQRKLIHPYEFGSNAWKFLPSLVADGLVEAFFDNSELPHEDHELVELTIRGRDNLWREESKSEKQVHALTTFLIGPKSGAKEHVKSWFQSATKIGIGNSWSVLPLTFQFSINRTQLINYAPGSSSKFMAEAVYIYTNRRDNWTVDGSARLFKVYDDLIDAKGLAGSSDVLMATVRSLVAPKMAKKFEVEFLSLASEAIPLLDELKAMVRAQGTVEGLSIHVPVGKALGKHLYWSMCREAVGEEMGVPLQWVMNIFGCQKAAFSKLIDEVSVPHACPSCGSPGHATGVRLAHPHDFSAARYDCAVCGHIEAFGMGHSNQLTCPCTMCSSERIALMGKAKVLADGITDRLVEGASKVSDSDRQADYYGDGAFPLQESVAMSYAQLRVLGKSPHECAHILFEGSVYTGTTYVREWPLWASQALKTALLIQQEVEILFGSDARRFAREALSILISEGLEDKTQPAVLEELEPKLLSDSGAEFQQGIEMLKIVLRGGFLLPSRKKCMENASAIIDLADRANEDGREPAHIARDVYWHKKIKKSEFSPRRIPSWKA